MYIDVTKKEKFNDNDMTLLGKFVNSQYSEYLDYLPSMPLLYTKQYKLNNSKDKSDKDINSFSKHYNIFNKTIFDAAAIGQYIGGTNEEFKPKGSNSTIGYVNPYSVMDARRFTYEWRRDTEKRLVLYAIFKRTNSIDAVDMIRVNNIHVHCKYTEEFYSLREPKNCMTFTKSNYYSSEQKQILMTLHNFECT